MTMDELRKRRKELYHDLVANTRLYIRARKLYESLKERHDELDRRYHEVDLELALLDGRRTIVESEKKPRVPLKVQISDLDAEQLRELLELLEVKE